MAVGKLPSRRLAEMQSGPTGRETGHPLIEKCTLQTAAELTFETTFSVKTHWILDEHRIRGSAVVPGTAYLEMARAALEQRCSESGPIEIRGITFISPLLVGDDEARRVRVIVKQIGDAFDFAITSKPVSSNGSDAKWVQHATGTMNYVADVSRSSIDLQAIKERCVEQEIDFLRRQTAQRNYGPRWQTLKQVYFGRDEGLAVLELPEEYVAELGTLKLHPALLDFATSFLAMQYVAQGIYVPFNYHKLKIKAPLTSKLCSYAKLKSSDDAVKKQLAFELLITDEDGNELMEVEQFTMKRVSDQLPRFNSAAGSDEMEEAHETTETENDVGHGMRSSEGIEVFARVLSSSTLPQIIVSTRDFPELCRHYQNVKASTAVKAIEEARVITAAHPRPALANAYAAPRNEMEETIADIWQRVLGIENIGISDDFFDLGGDSLVALQLMSRLRESFNVEPPLVRFFESPTISSLALLVVQQLAEMTDQNALSEILLELERDSSQAIA
jgi:acyl carrier protein